MIRYLLTLFLIFVAQTPSFALDVSINVTETAGLARTYEPVTIGVPFSKEANVLTTSNMTISGYDAQFRVLSRYGGLVTDGTKPIRVVQADFRQSVAANGTNTVHLTDQGTGNAAGMLASDQSTYLEISTGAMVARINKTSGKIFDSVSVGGNSVLSSASTGDNWVVTYSGTDYFSVTDTASIVENGPLRCTLRLQGHFVDGSNNSLYAPKAPDGLIKPGLDSLGPVKWRIFYHAYKNKSHIRLQASLQNENRGWATAAYVPPNHIHIDQSYIQTTLNSLTSSKTVDFGGLYSDTGSDNAYDLTQLEDSDGSAAAYNFNYSITKNASSVATGTKFDSYVDISDPTVGLSITERWFWQNSPNGVSIDTNKVRYNLWPDTGTTHRVIAGSWKTHDLVYYFHPASATDKEEVAQSIKNRLMAIATDTYYAQTNFFWGLLPKAINSTYVFPAGERMQKVIDNQSLSMQSTYDESVIVTSVYHKTMQQKRDIRNVLLRTGFYGSWYGPNYFGLWPNSLNMGYNNQHYDWTYVYSLAHLRFSDVRAREEADILSWALCDMLQIHDPDAPFPGTDMQSFFHGGQRYEVDALLTIDPDGRYNGVSDDPARFGHQWNGGLALQYLITGDWLYKETLDEVFLHAYRMPPYLTGAFGTERRQQIRCIDLLMWAWMITGEQKYINQAWWVWRYRTYPLEGGHCPGNITTCVPDGTSGWLWMPLPSSEGVTYTGPGGDAWDAECLVRLEKELKDAGMTTEDDFLRAFMDRWANWIKRVVFSDYIGKGSQGDYNEDMTQYNPWIGYYAILTATDQYDLIVRPTAYNNQYLQPYSEIFGWKYLQTGDEAWLNLARVVEKDSRMYGSDAMHPVTDTWTSIGIIDTSSGPSWKISKFILKFDVMGRIEAGLDTPSGTDTSSPSVYISSPTEGEVLDAGTTQIDIAATASDATGVSNIRRASSNMSYGSMTDDLTYSAGVWGRTRTGLQDGQNYTECLGAIDTLGNASAVATCVNYSVGVSEVDTEPPILTNLYPETGHVFPSGTTSIGFSASVADASGVSGVRVSGQNTAYGSMTDSMSNVSGATWSISITGLQDGQSYTRCAGAIDALNNATTTGACVSFSVANATYTSGVMTKEIFKIGGELRKMPEN